MSESETKEDRISSLPDALLIHILSFLSTKDSFCTSVLSTRWKYLFTFVPDLSFHYDKHESGESFVKFVNEVLRVHNLSCIRSIKLLVYTSCYIPDVCSWITSAIQHNVRRIEVVAQLTRRCSLSLDLFTCQMLVHLELRDGFLFGVIDIVCLPALKAIFIERCTFTDGDSARRLFSSCPKLEEITVCNCGTRGIKVMSISVPSLKSLTIVCDDAECEWELNVPNLEYLSCTGLTAKWYSVCVLKSLRKAVICLQEDIGFFGDYDKIIQLVNKFEQVQFLSLSYESMQALEHESFSPSVFNKLTSLELKASWLEGWNLFPTLLERSPCLELLVIPQGGFSDFCGNFPEIDVLLPKRIPFSFSRSLKEVKFFYRGRNKVEDEWLGYVLKNAKVLNKLTVFVASVWKEDYFAYLERQYIIRKKLLALPRSSNTCEVVLKETTIYDQ